MRVILEAKGKTRGEEVRKEDSKANSPNKILKILLINQIFTFKKEKSPNR